MILASWIGLVATVAVAGGMFYLLAVDSVRRLRSRPHKNTSALPPVSVLKPLAGREDGLEYFLETFFVQDYPQYELLFAVEQQDDPAVPVVEALLARHPQVPAKLLVVGQSAYANAKVWSMQKMFEQASYDILVVTDSDASVDTRYLRDVAAYFEDPKVGAVTHLYRGVASSDFWSTLEALGMSTEFMAGVVVAERLEGMRFALGPSMAIRRQCLEKIGGFAAIADYLADDFVLGKWAHESGYRVALSHRPIEHHASSKGFVSTFKHRLRWNKSARFSRPSGYYGQGFTYGLAWSLLVVLIWPSSISFALLLVSFLLRVWLAFELAHLLEDRYVLRRLHYLPIQDLISFISWLGGFLGREVTWRNRRYRLLTSGRFARIDV